jgi:hypothetical protein
MILESGFPILGKAVATIYGPSFGRLKGNFTFFTAIRTDCLVHLTGAKVSPPTEIISSIH